MKQNTHRARKQTKQLMGRALEITHPTSGGACQFSRKTNDTEMYKASLQCVTSKGCDWPIRTRKRMASAISRASHCADAKPLIPHKAPVAAQRLPQEAEALPVDQKHPAVDAGHLLSPSVKTSIMGGHPVCGRLKGRYFWGVPNEQTNKSKQKDKHTGSLCGCLLVCDPRAIHVGPAPVQG